MQSNQVLFVGLDVHKNSISACYKKSNGKGNEEFKFDNTKRSLKKFVRRVRKHWKGEVSCCYEAGPCGFVLQKQLREVEGFDCEVIAPSLVPYKPGDRIKTDRRDARKLSEMFEGGFLTAVSPPSGEEEAVRDLCRCLEDNKEDQRESRQQINAFLLRRGYAWSGKSNWTQGHLQWLRTLKLENSVDQMTLDDYVLREEQARGRVELIMGQIEKIAEEEPYQTLVGYLRCFRGIDTYTAMVILSELYDFSRFQSPRELMSYLGLVPSEHSSGDRVVRGKITKTGNKYVRKVLVEVAQNNRGKPRTSKALMKRRKGQPPKIIAIADKAQHRLHKRYMSLLLGKGKAYNKVMVAMAREFVGFIWAVLYPHCCEQMDE